jgi:hypothetical protein
VIRIGIKTNSWSSSSLAIVFKRKDRKFGCETDQVGALSGGVKWASTLGCFSTRAELQEPMGLRSMLKRNKPLVIAGRTFTDPLALELAQYLTPARVDFIGDLRISGQTHRQIAEECAKAWQKPWDGNQNIGYFLCALAAAHLGEDPTYFDAFTD